LTKKLSVFAGAAAPIPTRDQSGQWLPNGLARAIDFLSIGTGQNPVANATVAGDGPVPIPRLLTNVLVNCHFARPRVAVVTPTLDFLLMCSLLEDEFSEIEVAS